MRREKDCKGQMKEKNSDKGTEKNVQQDKY